MPAGEKSHAESQSPRPRVTDTHGPYAVGEFRVLRVGSTVALHLATPSGRFVFHVAERSFTLHARSGADDQGNKWREIYEIDAERTRIVEDAAEKPAPLRRDSRRIPVATEALYLAAYIDLKNSPGSTWREIANKHRLPQASWSTWCYQHPRECAEALVGSRPLILKPNGHLL